MEVKNSTIGNNSKVNHLTYIGDAEIGKNVNIGAGTITCNYDGKKKHKTIIEDEVFIGSNSSIIAPVKIGKKSYIGSGSAISKDVKPKSLAVERSVQMEIKNWSKKVKKFKEDSDSITWSTNPILLYGALQENNYVIFEMHGRARKVQA